MIVEILMVPSIRCRTKTAVLVELGDAISVAAPSQAALQAA